MSHVYEIYIQLYTHLYCTYLGLVMSHLLTHDCICPLVFNTGYVKDSKHPQFAQRSTFATLSKPTWQGNA